ncbi:MAG: zinc-binding protein [SAR202 cluster bacterium]|nr:zinc-binding protein [SAR202 cluster bacterium]
MALQDKNLTCRDCGQTFVFTAGEQEFFQQKGYTNEPQRCPSCRSARRSQSGDGFGRGPRQMFPAVCAQCGKDTQVPFQPRGDRPVYCSDCFSKQGGGTRTARR